MVIQLPELDTRSVFNVVEENFQAIGLKTYAQRMIYIGEHTLPRYELIEHITKVVNGVNNGYCDINLYGILLVYDSYFVHILEGSEDTIHRHIRFMFEEEQEWIKKMERLDEEAAAEDEDVGLKVIMQEQPEKVIERKIFKRLKFVMVYDSLKTLEFTAWRAIIARPPSLVGKLDVYGPLQEHLEQLRIFLNKINKLCAFADADPNLSFEGLSAIDPKMEALPEVALMDYLLQSQYILDFRETAKLHRRIDDYQFYFEQVWPLPTHFTPRLLYKLKIDDSFVEKLPKQAWEMEIKKDTEEEDAGANLDLIPDIASADSSD